MFRIGDFSRIARVSARLLRFYDELGLLAPAHADAQTGYRHYTVAQLAQLNRITVLKELGFSLEQIGDLLKSPPDANELRRMLLMRRNDAEQKLAQESQRLRHIETRIAQIESEGTLSVADARLLIPIPREHARPLLPKTHGCPLMAIAHAPQFEADELDVEFGYAV